MIRRFVVLFAFVSLFMAGHGVAHAQDNNTSKYFLETGHNVTGEFWKYYKSFANANQIFGYPLTEAFTDGKSKRIVQYFTHVRFELYPEDVNQPVHLSGLGSAIYVAGQGVDIFTPVGCRTFSNGLAVCFSFLDFFDKNGGQVVFGQPISSFQFSNGRIVQYFERARFEWYPEYGEGQKVVLADLGRIYFDVAKEDANLLQAVPANDPVPAAGNAVLSLHTRAFVWKAVTQPTDQQVIYVVVQDQTLRPVSDAKVKIMVYWSNGSPSVVDLMTDKNGVAVVRFSVQSQGYGSLITIDVKVEYPGLNGPLKDSAVTSFRIWQ